MNQIISEQPDLFNPERLPHKPYCKDAKAAANLIRSLKSALKRPYISVNPPKLRFWSVFDIDRPGAALAWEDANLPPPAWCAVNRENAHAHLAWGLSAPVLTGDAGARDAPLRYLAAIESAFRHTLGADQGYAGPITKNPTHAHWKTLWGPPRLYELSELAEYVDLSKHWHGKGKKTLKVENVGLGRNCTLFDRLRVWAYVAIRQYRGARGGLQAWNAWLDECYTESLMFNGDFSMAGGEWHSLSGPLSERECWWVARSVAKFCWRHDAEAEARFRARQSEKGKAGMLSRWGDNEDKVASARLMRAGGMTQAAIARELGVHVNTVANWTKQQNPQ